MITDRSGRGADSTLPHQRVSAAVEQVETEASVELEESLI
jgi:hypothetical protein